MILENNCLIVSAAGFGISKMAGGDYDGDIAMMVFSPQLIRLVELISMVLPNYGLDDLGVQLRNELGEHMKLPFRDTDYKNRLHEYNVFGHNFNDIQLRGCITAMAEKSTLLALLAPDSVRKHDSEYQSVIMRALSIGVLHSFRNRQSKALHGNSGAAAGWPTCC